MPEEIKQTGGNQYVVDPRQGDFLKYYLDKKSDTFSDAYQSAIKAKYSETYAENITALMPDWLSESIGNLNVLKKAEKRLNETLDLKVKSGNKIDSNLLRIVIDVAKFIAERIGKEKYSTKQEVEHSGGITQTEEIKLDKATAKFLEEFISKRKKKI